MKISVITATWNSAATITDTLNSLQSQNYENIEYIVIDGASTDNTVALIKQHGVKVDILISENDAGIYDALNKGIKLASGDVLGFLHSDDIYAHSAVLSHISEAFSTTKCDSVFGDLEYVAKSNVNKVIRKWKSGEYNKLKLAKGWMPPHPTFYMKKAIYDQLGGFDLTYNIAADYDSILRYYSKGKITSTYIPEVLLKMRVGGESNRSIKNVFNKSREDYRALRSNGFSPLIALFLKNISKIPQFFAK